MKLLYNKYTGLYQQGINRLDLVLKALLLSILCLEGSALNAQTFYGNDIRFGTQASNLISNGSFENGTTALTGCVAGNTYTTFPNRDRKGTSTIDGGWVPTGHSVNVGGKVLSHTYMRWRNNFNTASSLPDGVSSIYFGNGNVDVTNGATPTFTPTGLVTWSTTPALNSSQGLLDNNNCADATLTSYTDANQTPTTLSYTTSALVAGHNYHFEFWVAGENPTYYTYNGAALFEMTGAATLSQWFGVPSAGDKDFSDNVVGLGTSQRYHVTFTAASSAPVTFKWSSYGHIYIAPKVGDELVVDDVILTDVSIDTDGDGILDTADIDDDNDGILDTDECAATFQFAPFTIANGASTGTAAYPSGGTIGVNLLHTYTKDGSPATFVHASGYPYAGTAPHYYDKLTNDAALRAEIVGADPTHAALYQHSNFNTGGDFRQKMEFNFATTTRGYADSKTVFGFAGNYPDVTGFYDDELIFTAIKMDGSVETDYSGWQFRQATNPVLTGGGGPNGYTEGSIAYDGVTNTSGSFVVDPGNVPEASYTGSNDATAGFIFFPAGKQYQKIYFERHLVASATTFLPANYSAVEWEYFSVMIGEKDQTCDNDRDGIANHLDLDSDGDGCSDALEGSASFTTANLVNSSMAGGNSGVGYNGPSATAVIQNLGNAVGVTGIPTLAGAGQTIGTSQNSGSNECTADADNDGIADSDDIDDDNDGVRDADECASTFRFAPFTFSTNTATGTAAYPSGGTIGVNLLHTYTKGGVAATYVHAGGYPAVGTGPHYQDKLVNDAALLKEVGTITGANAALYTWSNFGEGGDFRQKIEFNFATTTKGYANDRTVIGFSGNYPDVPGFYDDELIFTAIKMDGSVETDYSGWRFKQPSNATQINSGGPGSFNEGNTPYDGVTNTQGNFTVDLGNVAEASYTGSNDATTGFVFIPAGKQYQKVYFERHLLASWGAYQPANYVATEWEYSSLMIGEKGAVCDTDNDGIANSLDSDSDGDGCSDAFEAGATTSKTANYQFAAASVGTNGLTNSRETNDSPTATTNYTPIYSNAVNSNIKLCLSVDTDGDGVTDDTDLDDDNDGLLDTDELRCDMPGVANSTSGSGVKQNQLYLFNWTDAVFADGIQNGDAQTFTLADGTSVTATFSNVTGQVANMLPVNLQTAAGAYAYRMYNSAGVKEAFYKTGGSTGTCDVTFVATKAGNARAIDIVAMDAENTGTANSESLSFTTNTQPWIFFDNYSTGGIWTGQGTQTVATTNTETSGGTTMFYTSTESSIGQQGNAATIHIDVQSATSSQGFAFGLYLRCDSDGDGILNSVDLDSDGDNCSDANETYRTSFAQGPDGNMYYGTGNPPATTPTGMVVGATYPGPNVNVVTAGTNGGVITVSTQPNDEYTTAGGNATFSALKTTTATPLQYQWQISTNNGTTWTDLTDDAVYSGATTINLTLTGATLAMNGYDYRLIIAQSNYVCNDVISNAAQLNVCPVITNSAAANVNPTTCAGTDGSIKLCGLDANGTGYIVNYNKDGVAATAVTGQTADASGCIVLSGLGKGAYTAIKVSHATSCPAGSNALSATLTDPALPTTPTATITQPSCGVTTATITINTPSSGVTYSFDNGANYQASNIKSGLAASTTYQLLAKNTTTNCVSAAAPSVITGVLAVPAAPTVTPTQPSCGVTTATITVNTPSSGVMYSFDNGVTFQASNIKSGLAASTTYQVVAKDNTSLCPSTATPSVITGVLAVPAAPTVTLTQPSCGVTTATITVNTPSSGVMYSFDNGATFQASNIKSGLAASTTYQVVVKDNTSLCLSTATPSVITGVLAVPAAPTVSLTQPSCGVTTATITVNTPSSGVDYSFDNGATFQASNIKSGLAASTTYQIVVKDNTSLCTSTATPSVITGVLAVPAAPTVTLTQPSCGVTTATITVNTPSSGVMYSFDNGATFQASNIKSGLAASTTYQVVVKDNTSNCVSTATPSVITGVLAVPATPTTTVTQPTCSITTGDIEVNTPSSGVTYSFDNGAAFQASNIKTGLTAGATYQVIVKDNTSLCTSPVTPSVINPILAVPTAPAVAITQPSCSVTTGTITVNTPATGVTYSFDNGANYQASNIKSGLAGSTTYQVIAKDNSSLCPSAATPSVMNATLAIPATPMITVTQPTCSVATGEITVTAPATGVTYSFDNGANFSATATESFLATGTYQIVVKDDISGCTSTASAVINAQPQTPSILAVSKTNPLTGSCPVTNTGTITVVGTGGSVQYSKDAGATWQPSGTFTALNGGTYTIRVGNSVGGCYLETTVGLPIANCVELCADGIDNDGDAAIDCNDSDCMNATIATIAANKTIVCSTGSTATLTASGGGTYLWSTGATSPSITTTTAGTYRVTVTRGTGCTDTASLVISTPSVNLLCGKAAIYEGVNTATLKAFNGSSFLWSTGATSQMIVAKTAGTYSVTTTGPDGCTQTNSYIVTAKAPLTVQCDERPNYRLALGKTPWTAETYAWQSLNAMPILSHSALDTSIVVDLTLAKLDSTYRFIQIATRYGLQDTDVIALKIMDCNIKPTIAVTPQTVIEDTPKNICVPYSDPNVGQTQTYKASCSPLHGTTTTPSVSAGQICFTYTPALNYNGVDSVCLILCDNDLNVPKCDTVKLPITVTPVNDTPVVVIPTPVPVTPTGPTTVCGTVTDIDPTDTHTTTIVCGPKQGSAVPAAVTGGQVCLTYTPNPSFSGNDTICVMVCDNGSPVLCDTVKIVLQAIGSLTAINDFNTTLKNTPVTSSVATNDLTNGFAGTFTSLSTSPNGVLTMSPNGTYTFTPTTNFVGQVDYLYKICNAASVCDTAKLSITVYAPSPNNDAPIANDDVIQTNKNIPVTGYVTGNDFDTDMDPLRVNPTPVTAPLHGSLVLNPNGSYTFTPALNFVGKDSFEYVVCDLLNVCDVAKVVIYVIEDANGVLVNDKPNAEDDLAATSMNVPVSGSIRLNDSDPNGANTTLVYNTTPLSMPTHGSVILQSNGNYTYGPNMDYYGNDEFKYIVCDAQGLCDTATVVIKVIPTVPDALNDINITFVNKPVSGNLTTNDSGNGLPYTLNTTPVKQPTNGTIAITPNGNYTYTPNAGFVGNDEVQYVICKVAAVCDTARLTITVQNNSIVGINNPPVAKNDVVEAFKNQQVVGTVVGNDFDIDGDPLLVTIAPVTPTSHGSLVMNVSGIYTYLPDPDYTGRDSFQYQLCDNKGACTTAWAFIFITTDLNNTANDKPRAQDDAVATKMGITVNNTMKPNDSDPNNNALVYQTSPVSNPAHGTVTIRVDGTYTYVPNATYSGTDQFVYAVCDNGTPSICDTATVYIVIPNHKPILVDSLVTNVQKDSTVKVCTTLNDPDSTDVFALTQLCTAQHGTATPSVLGKELCVTYTPTAGYLGADSVCIKVCDAAGLCDTIVFKFNTVQTCVSINLKVLLEGPFNTGTNLMNTTLNQRGLLPGQTPIGGFAVPTPSGQPYSGLPWNYAGSENVTNYATTVVDWVLVSFRTSPVLGSTVFRAAGLLHNDGTITFPNPCIVLPTGSFYVVIEHRNHLGIMSPSAVPVVNNTMNFDFTTGQSYVLTNPPSFGQKVKSTSWMMYAGDGKKNTIVTNYDINFSDSQLWKLESGIFDQYRLGDFNLDGDENFSDSQLWKLNNGRYSGVPH